MKSEKTIPSDKTITFYVVVVSILFYATSFATRLPLVQNIFGGLILGEELSCAFGAVASLEDLEQFDYYSSNFGAYLLFWLSSHILPFDLHYARITKLFIFSFLPVLSFLFCKYRLNLSLMSSFLCGLFILFNPTLINYSLIGNDMGLELVPGLLALFLMQFKNLNQEKIRVTIVFFLCGISASIYGAGFAFLLPALWWVIAYHQGSDFFRVSRGGIYGLLWIVVYLWPYFLIEGSPLPSKGGGSYCPILPCIFEAIPTIGKDLFIKPSSYHNFGNLPSFGLGWAAIFLIPLALGIVKLCSREMRGQSILIALTMLSSIAILLFSGHHAGIRRGLIFIVLLFFIIAIGFDIIFKYLKKPTLKFSLMFALMIMSVNRGYAFLNEPMSVELNDAFPSKYEELIVELEKNDIILKKGNGSIKHTESVLKLICNRRGLDCKTIHLE